MPWARYDDTLPMNAKIAALRSMGVKGIAALGLHVLANSYSRHEGTGGFIAEYVPEQLVGRCGPELARILADIRALPSGQSGMFDRVDGGWTIHDFDEYSDPSDPDPHRPASDRRRELSEKRRMAGSLGGRAKAAKSQPQPSSKPGSNGTNVPLANAWQTPAPVPVPVPVSSSATANSPPSRTPTERGGELDERLNQAADRYATRAFETANQSMIRDRAAFRESKRNEALGNPELARIAREYPTAPCDVIVAAAMDGDRHSLSYHERVLT